MSFLAELKRRNVIRVAIAYAAGAWLILQVADVVWPIYALSDEALRWLTTILAVGLLPAVVLAWVFEWTPEGIRRDADVEAGHAARPGAGRTFDRVVMVVLALAVVMFAIDRFVLDPGRDAALEHAAEQRGRVQALIDSYGDHSIAILPFVNMSPDPDQDYFSDGISEEILNLLARVKQLRVISRSSAFQYRGDVNIPEVAEALSVAYVLEGSVRKAGNTLRITAQLIDARADAHVWSETWDRELVDVFAIQDEVAAIVARTLEVEILGQELASHRTDPELYALFLKVKQEHEYMSATVETIERLEFIVGQDPDYVPALLELAWAYWASSGVTEFDLYTPDQGYALANDLKRRAYAIAPDDPMVNMLRAWDFLNREKNLGQAVLSASKAFAAGSGDTETLRYLTGFTRTIGKFDAAIAIALRSLALDPLCTGCYYVLSTVYIANRQFEEAEHALTERLKHTGGGWHSIGDTRLARGDAAGALEAYENQQQGFFWQISKAKALYSLGRIHEYRDLVASLEARADSAPAGNMARLYGWAGDTDNAIRWLETFIDQGREHVGRLLWYFEFDEIRDEPRWDAFWDEHWFTEDELAAVELNFP
jgi:TolB-like protein